MGQEPGVRPSWPWTAPGVRLPRADTGAAPPSPPSLQRGRVSQADTGRLGGAHMTPRSRPAGSRPGLDSGQACAPRPAPVSLPDPCGQLTLRPCVAFPLRPSWMSLAPPWISSPLCDCRPEPGICARLSERSHTAIPGSQTDTGTEHAPASPSPPPDLPLRLPPPSHRPHHLFQLILNLPVHFGHLKENVSWKGRVEERRERKGQDAALRSLQLPVAGEQGAGGPVLGPELWVTRGRAEGAVSPGDETEDSRITRDATG